MEIHRSAQRHGLSDHDIRHAEEFALVVIDVEPDADPPKVLLIGPDLSGNLIEVIVLELHGDRQLAIHAMALRAKYFELLPSGESDNA